MDNRLKHPRPKLGTDDGRRAGLLPREYSRRGRRQSLSTALSLSVSSLSLLARWGYRRTSQSVSTVLIPQTLLLHQTLLPPYPFLATLASRGGDAEHGNTSIDLYLHSLADYSYFGGADSLDEGRTPRRTEVPTPTEKDDGKHFTGPPQDPSDFLWLMTEEPHRSRRMAIMKAHPEVRVSF